MCRGTVHNNNGFGSAWIGSLNIQSGSGTVTELTILAPVLAEMAMTKHDLLKKDRVTAKS